MVFELTMSFLHFKHGKSNFYTFFHSSGILQWSVYSLLLQLPVGGKLEHKGLDIGMHPQQREVTVTMSLDQTKRIYNRPINENEKK